MDVLDIFLLLWVEPMLAPSPSNGLHEDMCTAVDSTKCKEPSSTALFSEKLTQIGKNNQGQLYAKNKVLFY